MENTTSRLELIRILSDLVRETPKNIIDKVVYLTQGKLYPDFLGIEIGVADKLAMRAITATSGRSLKEVEQTYHRLGDIGSAGGGGFGAGGGAKAFPRRPSSKRGPQ